MDREYKIRSYIRYCFSKIPLSNDDIDFYGYPAKALRKLCAETLRRKSFVNAGVGAVLFPRILRLMFRKTVKSHRLSSFKLWLL